MYRFTFVLVFICNLIMSQEQSKLVSVSWLKENLTKKELVLLDVSLDAKEYIPGSVNSYTKKTLNQKRGELVNEVADKGQVEKTLRLLGINSNSFVVIIWQQHPVFATRTFFVLDGYGVKAAILDGGVNAWKKKGYKVVSSLKKAKPGNITLANFRSKNLAILQEVKNAQSLIDSRSAKYFKGLAKKSIVKKSGTILGAVNLPPNSVLNADSTFKSKEQLQVILKGKKVQKGSIFFCNTGYSATLTWFASVIAGYQTKMYDGSMNEWACLQKCVPGK